MALELKGRTLFSDYLVANANRYRLTGCVWNGSSCVSTDIADYLSPSTLDFDSGDYDDPDTVSGQCHLKIDISTLSARQLVVTPPTGLSVRIQGILAYDSANLNEGALFGGTFAQNYDFPEEGTFTLTQMELDFT